VVFAIKWNCLFLLDLILGVTGDEAADANEEMLLLFKLLLELE
jgi:hypothetical protein